MAVSHAFARSTIYAFFKVSVRSELRDLYEFVRNSAVYPMMQFFLRNCSRFSVHLRRKFRFLSNILGHVIQCFTFCDGIAGL